MNRKLTLAIIAVSATIAAALGAWYTYSTRQGTAAPAVATGDGARKERKILYWADPMTPGFKSDKPGKSPFMDMELVPVYEEEGANVVSVRPEIVQNLGVRTYKVTNSAPPRHIFTTGYLFQDERGNAVLVDILERDTSLVRTGLPAEIRLTDVPGRTYRGTVTAIEPDIDIGARSLRARVRLMQADANVRPNMYAEVTIQAAATGRAALYIPREALIRTGTRNAVVLALGAGRFQPVEVVPGAEADDWVEIRRGIKEGDTVVTSGQFLIDSEANVRATFSRMQPPDAGTDAPAPAANPHAGH